MAHSTEPTTQAARKIYRCTWCWQCIPAGETYVRYRYFDGGDAGTCRMHPECHGAMSEMARDEGGYLEWTPGMERPAKTEQQPTKETP